MGYVNRNQPRGESTQELVYCSICHGEHPTSECPTLRPVYRPQGYQNNRQGYEGQNYRRFPYSQPPRAVAPLALPPAPQQAMIVYARSAVPASHSVPTSHLPPKPKITPVYQVTTEEVVEPEYEEVEGEEYQYIYPEYYVHDNEGPKPIYQVNAIGRGQAWTTPSPSML